MDTKNSPIGQIPEDWVLAYLKDITVKIRSGATPKGGQSTYLDRREKFALIRSQNVYDRHFDNSGLAFISDKQAAGLKGAEVLPDDVLLNITGDGITFARACIVPRKILPACVNQHVAIIRCKPNICDSRFLLSFLTHPNVKTYIENFNAGGSRRAITKSSIESFEIPLPSLSTQKRIVEILSTFDEKIELNRQTNATLEAIAQAIFKEWFVHYNYPVLNYDLDDYMKTMKAGGANHSESGNQFNHSTDMIDSELGMIPAGWRVGKLGDFGVIVCGKTPSKANPHFFGGKIPFIKIPDMHNLVFITQTTDSLTVEGAQSQKNKLLPPYSILVSCIATVGLVAITSESSQTNQQINSIIPNKPCYSFYLYFCAKGMEGLLKDLGSGGSTTLNVNTSTFSSITCLVPPDTLLERFDNTVRPIFEKILEHDMESATLAQIRDTLLPKLMRGEVV